MAKKRKTCGTWLSENDVWAMPVTLRFNNQRTVTTVAGGITTFLFRIIIALYILDVVVTNVVNGGGAEIKQSSVLKSHFSNEFYHIDGEEFMTGYQLHLLDDRTNALFGKESLK